MSIMLQILDTGISSAEANMALDEKLLEELDPAGEPILHLYQWEKPSATYGYFADPAKHLDLQKASERGLALAKRPTGGGIVFHIWDLAFSFLMPSGHSAFSPNTLENYRFVNEAVLRAVDGVFGLGKVELISEDGEELGPSCPNFCMAKPTRYDVVRDGRKIAGAAQRKRKQGYLHQGTISLAFPDLALLREVLLSKEEVARAMESYTFAPLGNRAERARLEEAREAVQKRLTQELMEKL